METERPSRRSFGVPLTIIALGAVVAGALLLARVPSASERQVAKTSPVATVAAIPAVAGVQVAPGVITITEHDPMLGAENAPVTMFIFTQFHCPFCRHFFGATFPQLKENLVDSGQVRLVFKPFPIGDDETSPEEADRTAEAALCAHAQGGFWTYLNHLSAVGAAYEEQDLEQYAAAADLDVAAFMACLRDRSYAEVVATNIREAVAAGITGTPTFVIRDELHEGALSYAELERLLW